MLTFIHFLFLIFIFLIKRSENQYFIFIFLIFKFFKISYFIVDVNEQKFYSILLKKIRR